ncbi:hypothetical protein DMUE_0422 [Dictyocoela muelleri]|nr:hypothetical protein DMUE_0422 [Dictyocoela muelleri]
MNAPHQKLLKENSPNDNTDQPSKSKKINKSSNGDINLKNKAEGVLKEKERNKKPKIKQNNKEIKNNHKDKDIKNNIKDKDIDYNINNDINYKINKAFKFNIKDKETLLKTLLAKKKEILDKARKDYEEFILSISPDILSLNSNLFLKNINKDFKSAKPLINRKPDIASRPSVIIQIEDQTFVLDQNKSNFPKNLSKNFVEDLANIVNKYYPDGFKKVDNN